MSATPIPPEKIADAVRCVDGLDMTAKTACFDVVFQQQPALLGAAVQLRSLGVDYATQDHAFHVLLVLFECFKDVPRLPRISERMVQDAFDNNAAMLRLYDAETPEEAKRLHQISVANHPEPNVLAFVANYFKKHFTEPNREYELVVGATKAVMDALVKAKQIAERQASN